MENTPFVLKPKALHGKAVLNYSKDNSPQLKIMEDKIDKILHGFTNNYNPSGSTLMKSPDLQRSKSSVDVI